VSFGDMAANVLYDCGVSRAGDIRGGLRLLAAAVERRSAFWPNEPNRKNAVNSMWLPARGAAKEHPSAIFLRAAGAGGQFWQKLLTGITAAISMSLLLPPARRAHGHPQALGWLSAKIPD
jgi:hypothetical protein